MHSNPSTGGDRGNTLAIVGLVLGILAILFAILFFPLGLVLGIAAIVLGVMGRRRFKRGETAKGGGPALAAIITGAIATVLALLVIAGVAVFLSDDDVQDEIKREQQRQEQTN